MTQSRRRGGKPGRPKGSRRAIASRDLTDTGTPETVLHKAGSVVGGNPALSAYPLGVLLSRTFISQDMHNAGLRYAFLWFKVNGKPLPAAPRFDRAGRGFDLEDSFIEKSLARIFKQARQSVELGFSPMHVDALESVAVFEDYQLCKDLAFMPWRMRTFRKLTYLQESLLTLLDQPSATLGAE